MASPLNRKLYTQKSLEKIELLTFFGNGGMSETILLLAVIPC
jgi:hypothetical protein